MNNITHLIDGHPVAGSGRSADVFNPSTGTVSGQVPLADDAVIQ